MLFSFFLISNFCACLQKYKYKAMSSRRTTMFSPNVESEMNDSDLKEEPARMVTRGNVKQIYDQNTGSYKRLRTRTTRSCAAKTLDERRQSYEKRRKLVNKCKMFQNVLSILCNMVLD